VAVEARLERELTQLAAVEQVVILLAGLIFQIP
jgi:hypothetical protein